MAQKKLQRFREIKTFANVLEYPENMPGNWNKYFRNEFPITLELACGKGEYAVGLAQLHAERNFIGVDIKGNRIWVGAKHALNNKNEIEEIWITFPDPQLRISKANKRLIHPRYLKLYKNILKPGGKIHLKTDSPDLYNFTKTVIELYNLTVNLDIDDVYNQAEISPELNIKTYYESLDIANSKKVFYLSFSLPEIIVDKDDELDNILKKKSEKQ